MSSDLQLTADILVQVKDKVLQDFEQLLSNVHKKMKEVDKEAKDMLSGLPKANKVNAILQKQGEKLAKNTEQIKKNTVAKKKNNVESKKQQSNATKTSASLGQLPGLLAKVRVGLGLVSFAGKTALASIALPAGILAGWTYLIKRFADAEKTTANAARAIQVSTKYYKALSLVADDAGLSVENLGDLHEELINRIGDAKENMKGGAGTAFSAIGLDPRDLESMDRTEAFLTTVAAIQKSNLSDMAKIRLGDELFGGEGNKALTHLINSKKSMRSLIAEYKELIFVSKDASESAQHFSKGFRNVTTIMGSLVTEGLQPVFSAVGQLSEYMIKTIIDNRREFTKFAKELGMDLLEIITYISRYLAYMISWTIRNKESIKRWGKVVFSVLGGVVLLLGYIIHGLGLLDEVTKGYSTTALLVVTAMVLWQSKTKLIIVALFDLGVIIKATVIPAIVTMSKVMWAFIIKAVAGMGSLVIAMLPVILTIGLLVTAGWLLYRNWDGVVKGLKAIWESFVEYFRVVTTPIIVMFEVMKATVQSLWDVLTTGGKNIPSIWGNTFKKIRSQVSGLKEDITGLIDTFLYFTGLKNDSEDTPVGIGIAGIGAGITNSMTKAKNLETAPRVSNNNVSNTTTHSAGNNVTIHVDGGDTEEVKKVIVDATSNH